jgi:peptide-methionine (R)-S-oxide reductase
MDAKTDTKQYPVTHTDAEWRKLLTAEQYDVMRGHGTERPGSCALNYEKRAGTFTCAGCGQVLFKSMKKFESGTGWPSFNDPESGAVEETHDSSYGMCAPRCTAAAAAAISATCFPTARRPRACGIASTASP